MSNERRRFFRIDDSLGVYFQTLGPEQAKAFAAEVRGGSDGVDYLSHFDNRIQTLLDASKIQSPVVAELVDLVNKKLNLVIQQLDIDAESLQRVAYSLRQVNISACGMAFFHEEPLDAEQFLELDLVLHPSELVIKLLAQVVSCDIAADEEPSYYIRLNFEMIKAADQELLIQHIVKRQSSQLKMDRDLHSN